jgi:hypothetical protein
MGGFRMTKPAKFTTFFAVAMVLLFGLCGFGLVHSNAGPQWWPNVAFAAGLGCLVCGVGLVVSFIWMLVAGKPR